MGTGEALVHKHHKVLVFDSGVGGLSVLAEIRRRLPCCEFIYACDNAAFPYGTKEEAELIARVEDVLKALIARVAPDIVVIACNTASTLALPQIRAHFSKPVIGVVPAIKPAARLSASRVIGLLATPATVERPYTRRLIEEFAAGCAVIPVGSSELVTIAEAKLRGEAPDIAAIARIIAPIFADERVDTLVLACTHFPLLKPELAQAAPRAVQWIDSGEAIARRVASFTGEPRNRTDNSPTTFACWLTGNGPDSGALRDGLSAMGASTIDIIAV